MSFILTFVKVASLETNSILTKYSPLDPEAGLGCNEQYKLIPELKLVSEFKLTVSLYGREGETERLRT